MRPVLLLVVAAFAAVALPSFQEPTTTVESEVATRLRAIAALEDEDARAERLDALWKELGDSGRIPWRSGETAVFLYRGDAESVAVAGDHTRWRTDESALDRIEPLDVWMRRDTFPTDARIDYKLVVDEDRWILDPANDAVQWSGFGPNSELAMPAYVPSPWTAPREGVARGTTRKDATFTSEHLGRDVTYRVHVPAKEHRGEEPLAVLFVTDGHEYLDPRLGALAVVHDNLLAARRIRPVLLVFVDPRSNGKNLRRSELASDPRLGRALCGELLPTLESAFDLTDDAAERGVLGTSLGGVAATLISARHRDVIGLAAVQSPALWVVREGVDEALADDAALPARAFVSWGTVFDGAEQARALADEYEARGVPLTRIERNEGHSWGQWSALLDDALIALYPPRGKAREGGR